MRATRPILAPFALILTLGMPHVSAEQTHTRSKAAPSSAAESPWLEWQVRLDRAGFSPGEIDGVEGANTRRAMEVFARARAVEIGNAAAVQEALRLDGAEILTTYAITGEDAAGPNGPVGTVWIDISKPHYGIHGTSEPGKVGHVTSHGCVRLTNWDAETVAAMVRKGTVVIFEP